MQDEADKLNERVTMQQRPARFSRPRKGFVPRRSPSDVRSPAWPSGGLARPQRSLGDQKA